MIKIIDTIDVSSMVDELKSCADADWHETKEWINPTDYSSTTVSQEGMLNGQCVAREQDRLHIIWQADDDGKNTYWWKNPAWRDQAPVVTYHGTRFSKTIQQLREFWQQRDQNLERAFFSRLRPGAQIYPHRDAAWGTGFDLNTRYGVVVSTNPDCTVTAQQHSVNPEPGTVFWFDNSQEHSAANNGSTDRIYLYIDVKPKI